MKQSDQKQKKVLSRRALQRSALGLIAAPLLLPSKPAKAQFMIDFFGDLFNPDALFLNNVDYNPVLEDSPPEETAEPLSWSAVDHYVGSNTEYLAPKVPDFVPQDPPMPHFRPLSELEDSGKVYRIDRERSNASGEFEVEGEVDGFLKQARNHPQGFIAIIPPGDYDLVTQTIYAYRGYGYDLGARFVFRGEIGEDGSHPKLNFSVGSLSVTDHASTEVQTVFASLEVENVEMTSSSTGLNGGPGVYIRYHRYDNVLFSGGFKNANAPVTWPSIGIYNNCVFARAGRGGGLTHSFYAGYCSAIIARNCLFTSANRQGHALKVYAEQVDLRGCTIANWWHEEDRDEGFYGELAPLDIGARAQTIVRDCHFLRRGGIDKSRNTPFIDVRNRVYVKGVVQPGMPDYGTADEPFDHISVDNEVGTATERDPSSDLLYRHLFIGNEFYNGILPDGSRDLTIEQYPGYSIRNNGTIFAWAHGEGALPSSSPQAFLTPTDFGLSNERSVVYVYDNQNRGVPVRENYPGPYRHESDPNPIVDLTWQHPDWVLNRLNNDSAENHWWDTSWPSEVAFHPAPIESE